MTVTLEGKQQTEQLRRSLGGEGMRVGGDNNKGQIRLSEMCNRLSGDSPDE